MIKKFLLLLLSFSEVIVFAQYTEKDIYHYIETYKDIAIRKMYEYKIPASITLAQGIFESACGMSRLATVANNHFGIKCHNDWKGDTIHVDDDALAECFRKYNTPEESYNDHSLFLTTRSRYSNLFALDIMDYEAWAKTLKSDGYATNPKYAERLISLIVRFNIAQWDSLYLERLNSGYFLNPQNESLTNLPDEPNPSANPSNAKNVAFFIPDVKTYEAVDYPFTNRIVYENNKTLFVIAKKGDTYAKIARDVQRPEKNILAYNDVVNHRSKKLTEGEAVYIEKKEKNNPHSPHNVSKGETLLFIAQKYAIRLSSLLKINGLTTNSIIRPGDKIKLNIPR